MEMPADKGAYVLVLQVPQLKRMEIGRLVPSISDRVLRLRW
jgi:hypothetical protein